MKALLANLSSRERQIIFIGAAVTLLLVLLFTWLSLNGRVQRLESTVRDQKALSQWMHAAAQQVAQLRGMQSRGPARRVGRPQRYYYILPNDFLHKKSG